MGNPDFIMLVTLGTRTDGVVGTNLLAEAVDAYRAILTVYTKEALPQQWAASLRKQCSTDYYECQSHLKRANGVIHLLSST